MLETLDLVNLIFLKKVFEVRSLELSSLYGLHQSVQILFFFAIDENIYSDDTNMRCKANFYFDNMKKIVMEYPIQIFLIEYHTHKGIIIVMIVFELILISENEKYIFTIVTLIF